MESAKNFIAFCARCWPEESARYEARWKYRRPNTFSALFGVDAMPEGSNATRLFDLDPMPVSMGFETATWYPVSHEIERVNELLQLVRSKQIPTEEELVQTAVNMARDIESQIDMRVGAIPMDVGHFLLEFGSDSAAATAMRAKKSPEHSAPHSTSTRAQNVSDMMARADASRAQRQSIVEARNTEALDAEIAAAHQSADAIIAEFDKALESLTAPVTPESRTLIERELVEMLQQLEQEIATEAAAMENWQSHLNSATKSGDVYTAAKLSRQGEDRMLRLDGLRSTIADVEELHERMLGQAE